MKIPSPHKRKRWSYTEHMKDCSSVMWITKAGTPVLVSSMKDGHLVNTVHLLRRKAPAARMVELLLLIAGPRPSGDMASLEFNQVLEEAADETLEDFLLRTCPPYRAMLDRYDECYKRVRNEEDRFLDEALYDPWGDS